MELQYKKLMFIISDGAIFTEIAFLLMAQI